MSSVKIFSGKKTPCMEVADTLIDLCIPFEYFNVGSKEGVIWVSPRHVSKALDAIAEVKKARG